jgi:Cuticle protein
VELRPLGGTRPKVSELFILFDSSPLLDYWLSSPSAPKALQSSHTEAGHTLAQLPTAHLPGHTLPPMLLQSPNTHHTQQSLPMPPHNQSHTPLTLLPHKSTLPMLPLHTCTPLQQSLPSKPLPLTPQVLENHKTRRKFLTLSLPKANRGAVHTAPLPGHAVSQTSVNVAPAPGTW